MKLFSILLLAVSAFAVSCERHEFNGPNGTKQLNETHGHGAHPKEAEHGEHSKAATPHQSSEAKPAH